MSYAIGQTVRTPKGEGVVEAFGKVEGWGVSSRYVAHGMYLVSGLWWDSRVLERVEDAKEQGPVCCDPEPCGWRGDTRCPGCRFWRVPDRTYLSRLSLLSWEEEQLYICDHAGVCGNKTGVCSTRRPHDCSFQGVPHRCAYIGGSEAKCIPYVPPSEGKTCSDCGGPLVGMKWHIDDGRVLCRECMMPKDEGWRKAEIRPEGEEAWNAEIRWRE